MIRLAGKTLKHKRALDTAIQVLTCHEGSTHYKLKIRWVNLAFVQAFLIFGERTFRIEIAKDDIHNWAPVTEQRTLESFYLEEWS